ncbi:MAG: hypothetical protein ACK5OO_03310, partial [Cyclobacteriaceae bacterium]
SEQAGFALKKKRRAMSKLLSFFFREIKKKVSISYFSICCVRNLRPPFVYPRTEQTVKQSGLVLPDLAIGAMD